MTIRSLIVPAMAASLLLAACKKEPPPPPPAPTGPTPEEIAAQRRADSIRRERERQDSIRRAEEEARRREAERQRRIREARETLTEMVFFDFDESAIKPSEERKLRAKVDILRANPSIRLRLDGHADERGSTEYNLALGARRAEAVKEFFVGFGLDASRFTTQSFGEERPLVNRSDEEAWAQNRRVEFHITAGEIGVGENDRDRP
ncbi:MAG: hypothetical protein D6701_06555 [Gemmatimonadetes bacterium]|nr:MAG: hypothetical protein D6701_06555 [Gemmatimonadota bacterium]